MLLSAASSENWTKPLTNSWPSCLHWSSSKSRTDGCSLTLSIQTLTLIRLINPPNPEGGMNDRCMMMVGRNCCSSDPYQKTPPCILYTLLIREAAAGQGQEASQVRGKKNLLSRGKAEKGCIIKQGKFITHRDLSTLPNLWMKTRGQGVAFGFATEIAVQATLAACCQSSPSHDMRHKFQTLPCVVWELWIAISVHSASRKLTSEKCGHFIAMVVS